MLHIRTSQHLPCQHGCCWSWTPLLDECRALSSRNEEPQQASRPWDTDRDGFVMGEGAGECLPTCCHGHGCHSTSCISHTPELTKHESARYQSC